MQIKFHFLHYCSINIKQLSHIGKSSRQRCSVKMKEVFLEISQNSYENTCAIASFLMGLRPATLLKKRLWHRCFPMNFVEFLITPFLQNTSGRLLLYQKKCHEMSQKCLQKGLLSLKYSNIITFVPTYIIFKSTLR